MPDSLEEALVLAGLERPPERGLREAPERVAAEPDRERPEQEPAETRRGDLLERARTVLSLPCWPNASLSASVATSPN